MSYPECYELIFSSSVSEDSDTVTVRRTEYKGAGGHPLYMDDTGIVKAEISDRGEVRMLATGGHQALRRPVHARPVHAAHHGSPHRR